MAHFAKVENRIVTQVIVAEEDFIATGILGHGWVQTSYNTFGNQHPNGTPLRGNYAGIGYTYDAENDVFIAPQPYSNWILNTTSWLWEPPVAMPQDEYFYIWDQEAGVWNKGELRPVPPPEPEPVVEAPVVEEPVAETAVETTPVEEAPVAEAPVEPVVEAPVEQPAETPAVAEAPVVEEVQPVVEETPAEVVETPAEPAAPTEPTV